MQNFAVLQFRVEGHLSYCLLRPHQCQVQSVLVQIQKVGTHLAEVLLLHSPPQNLADPRQGGDRFVSNGLTDKVPMLLRCCGHPDGTNEPEPEVSTGSVLTEELALHCVINLK